MKKKNYKPKFSIYVLGARFFSHALRAWKESAGQSLVEIIIGLAIGAILIGASALAIAAMLNSNVTTQKWKAATVLSQSLLDNARAYGSVNWQNLYGLTKTSSTQYFLNASGTTYNVIQGKEGMVDNDVTNGLVGEWKFDEDAGTTSTLTYDASGNGNNGTLVGSPIRATSTCKIGNCLKFNGADNYVSVTNSATVKSISTTGTIATWINLTVAPTSTNLQLIADVDGTASCTARGMIFYISATQFKFQYGSGGACQNASSVTVPATNQWFHIVATWDGLAGAKMYVNGTSEGNNVAVSNVSIAQASTYIASQAGTTSFINGLVDDLRIYNRALSADEVKQLYNANIFTRYFYVENTCRTNDASSSISGVASCAGGSADDPSTQKVSAVSQWAVLAGTNQLSLADYITRWRNTIFQQNDWSGGASATGTYTSPTNLFSTSSNANTAGKSIRIQGL
ncbi:MAG: LamG domain-containing protein [Patescibacteria group bacterium]